MNHSVLTKVYFALAVLGFVFTWYFNLQYLSNGGGLAPSVFFGAAFANALTTAITIDVYVAAVVFAIWVLNDAKRISVARPWLFVLLCFCIGLAVALPLYLAVRERTIAKLLTPV